MKSMSRDRLSRRLKVPIERRGSGRTARPGRGLTADEFAVRAATAARKRGASVLDIGFEEGRHQSVFDAERYTSVQLQSSTAAARFDRAIRPQPMAELPVVTEGFGLVFCADVVERSDEPQALLTELNRALEPEGLLFLSSPLIVPASPNDVRPRRPRFGLNYLLDASGFAIEDLQVFDRGEDYAVIATKSRLPGCRSCDAPVVQRPPRTGAKKRPV